MIKSTKTKAIRNHVRRHRAKYAVGATLTVVAYGTIKRAKQWNEFLNEHGLLDEFYAGLNGE